jgi:G:T-mismatch repair DNA endonuclease (very short patch repair protein)
MENLQNIADECYQEFISDESIIGFEGLIKSKGLGSKRKIRVRNMIYEKYGKENLINIYRHRQALARQKHRSKDYRHSTETKKRISDSNTITWSERPDLKELGRENMIRFCAPYSQSDIAKKKRVESRRWYRHSKETIEKIRESNRGRHLTEEHKAKLRKKRIRRGVPHSEETKKKLSDITRNQWKAGIHKRTYKSKGQLQVISILEQLGYDVKDEHLVDGRPFDVYIKDKNLLIEFNGTFWHRDPRIEKYKNDPLREYIWSHDKEKIDSATSIGYDVKVIWQMDWESCQDKVNYIKKLLC